MLIVRWGRFWAVYDGDELLCITVYLKGARASVGSQSEKRETTYC